jgi:hypothetical protein
MIIRNRRQAKIIFVKNKNVYVDRDTHILPPNKGKSSRSVQVRKYRYYMRRN